ncbi:cell division protein SepF [Brevibacterium yomogidense]|uniref:cell division protein SepF n=1 Tax=Brevibacterium yomogidense TaxID=946573 RepID=UPI0018DFDADB|nr:cell division protein SepF [Brevibacterium yomogidense]
MSAMRKVASYLGFVEDEDDPRLHEGAARDAQEDHEAGHGMDLLDDEYDEVGGFVEEPPAATVSPIRTSVRPIESVSADSLHTIRTIHPRSYNDAKAIGQAFRDGVPVIMDLSAMDEANSKRLVDFSAGLIFGLHGSIEKVTGNVFLLTPERITVTTETDERGDEQASFFNQS